MKRTILLFALFAVLSINASCGSSADADSVPKTPEVPGVPEVPEVPEVPGVPEVPNPIVVGSLTADGKSVDTYKLMTDSGYNYETPDLSGSHAEAPFQHIQQVMDSQLGKYVFEFYIHIDIDDDRGITTTTDRQRNEIKTDSKSPATMVASEGQTHTYSWKFKLPNGFISTKEFTHIHQIKGYGGSDINNPVLTFTTRKRTGGKEYLEVIHVGSLKSSASKKTYLKEVALSDFIGEWVEVTEKATYKHEGSYSLKVVRVRDNKELILIDNLPLDLWRGGATAMRPKYGIYRSFGKEGVLKPEMRDEVVRFADFTLVEE